MHWKTFSSIPGLYPLDASSTPPASCVHQKCLLTLHMCPGGQSYPKNYTQRGGTWEAWREEGGFCYYEPLMMTQLSFREGFLLA